MSKNRPFFKKHLRRLRYLWATLTAPRTVDAAGAPAIDVVIPAIEKDLGILPLCVEGIRRCVANPVRCIYLVAPDTEAMRRAAVQLDLEFVDERRVLGYAPRELHYVTVAGNDRSGWLYQQLLKLSGGVGTEPYFLVIDADHVLLQKHTFVDAAGHQVMYRSSEYHAPYYEAMARLLGIGWVEPLSYVAHKMVFDRQLLDDMRSRIERIAAPEAWDKAIIAASDMATDSPFSEYETYGHFVPDNKKISLPWRQKTLRKGSVLPTYDALLKRYGRWMSVTFPDYLKTI